MTADAVQTLLIAALLSGSVAATVINFLLIKRSTRTIERIRTQLAEQLSILQSRRAWKERSMSELLGPLVMQLDRTGRAFKRYKDRNIYLETKVLREANLACRDLLLSHGHLIPLELLEDAGRLVEHFDIWLEEFDRKRGGTEPDLDAKFIFVGPAGYPFPHDAERRFRERFDQLWLVLDGAA